MKEKRGHENKIRELEGKTVRLSSCGQSEMDKWRDTKIEKKAWSHFSLVSLLSFFSLILVFQCRERSGMNEHQFYSHEY